VNIEKMREHGWSRSSCHQGPAKAMLLDMALTSLLGLTLLLPLLLVVLLLLFIRLLV
jgi:hypothetical protein